MSERFNEWIIIWIFKFKEFLEGWYYFGKWIVSIYFYYLMISSKIIIGEFGYNFILKFDRNFEIKGFRWFKSKRVMEEEVK